MGKQCSQIQYNTPKLFSKTIDYSLPIYGILYLNCVFTPPLQASCLSTLCLLNAQRTTYTCLHSSCGSNHFGVMCYYIRCVWYCVAVEKFSAQRTSSKVSRRRQHHHEAMSPKPEVQVKTTFFSWQIVGWGSNKSKLYTVGGRPLVCDV